MLSCLKILHFRNLSEIDLAFNATCNFFTGNNGSGKTSLLEAIHYLGLARSFRTHLNSRLIQHEQTEFSIHGKVEQDNLSILVGIQRSKSQAGRIRIGSKNHDSPLELAKILPLQFIDGEAHHLFLGGSKYRRQFLDWGVFHVEPSFFVLWHRATQALKQRNAALRARLTREQIELWEEELATVAEPLHHSRRQYIEKFIPEFMSLCQVLLPECDIKINYHRGWPQDKFLSDILALSRSRDIELGYSQFGPQRADLIFKIKNTPAHDMLSQGQQKLLTYALRLTQGILLTKTTHKTCLYLIDDLPSELDPGKQQLVAKILSDLRAQLFITGINQKELLDLFSSVPSKMFYVEQGKIRETDEKSIDYIARA